MWYFRGTFRVLFMYFPSTFAVLLSTFLVLFWYFFQDPTVACNNGRKGARRKMLRLYARLWRQPELISICQRTNYQIFAVKYRAVFLMVNWWWSVVISLWFFYFGFHRLFYDFTDFASFHRFSCRLKPMIWTSDLASHRLPALYQAGTTSHLQKRQLNGTRYFLISWSLTKMPFRFQEKKLSFREYTVAVCLVYTTS